MQVHQDDLEIPAELPQNLAASAAGRGEGFGIGGDGDACEPGGALRDRLENSDSFGADREPIGGILDVATGKYGSLIHTSGGFFEGSANLEARVGRVCVFAGSEGGVNEEVPGRAHREHHLTVTGIATVSACAGA